MSPSGLQLATVLAQLRRDVLHAEQLVHLLLGGARVRGALVHDPVLGDVEAALHGGGPERLVVLPRAREVLQQVAEVLGRHDPEVDRQPVVGHGAHARCALALHLADQGQLRERLRERVGIGARGHDVEVLAALGPAPRGAGHLHAVGRRVLLDGGHERVGDRKRLREEQPLFVLNARLERELDVLLGLRAEAWHVAQLLLVDRALEVVERSHAEDVEQLAGLLRSEARQARDLDEAGRVLRLQLLRRGDLAGVEQRVQLLLERLADAGDAGDRASPRHVFYGGCRFADGLGRVAVGDDAVHDRAVQLVEVGELVEVECDFRISQGSLGYGPAPCPPPGSSCRPTTRPRTSSGSCVRRSLSSPPRRTIRTS
jgi:hypothetical protein